MRLHPQPFTRIREGTQVIESRLNEVVELIHAPTFRDLFAMRPLTEFGIEDGNFERVENMYQYYNKEDEAKYGVIGIKFKKLL